MNEANKHSINHNTHKVIVAHFIFILKMDTAEPIAHIKIIRTMQIHSGFLLSIIFFLFSSSYPLPHIYKLNITIYTCYCILTMNIGRKVVDGILSYSLQDVEKYLKEERATFFIEEYMMKSCPSTLHYKDDYMYEESLIKFMRYIYKEYSILTTLSVIEYIKVKRRNKRKYSTTHRIEIAYKSKYKCNSCDMLLPPTFEIDHIVELQDGGEDTYENCQALCPNCHAEKTRANQLRKDKAFAKVYGKKFEEMQVNAFDKFKYRSKYF